jgi:hypothetical protein
MPRLAQHLVSAAFALLIAGCVPGLPGSGGGGKDPKPSAITGGDIEVTALDDAPAAPPPGDDKAAQPPEAETAEKTPDAKDQPAEAAAETPAAAEGEPETEPETEEAGPEAPVVVTVPEELKTPEQISCEKKKGLWSRYGSSSFNICVRLTGQNGKRCTKKSDCKGECLARSGTCSPYDPLTGCNEVLQDNGARVNLCLN